MDFLEKTLKIYDLLRKAAKDDTSEVATIAVCDGDSLLMGKRRDNGRWTLPGGHLDKGEEKNEGAVRELFEEAGIKVDAKDLKYLGSKDVTTFTGKKKKIHAFKYNWEGERPTTKNDPDKEVGKWEWIDCKGGIVPTEIVENSHTPVDKNCVFSFMGMKSAEKKEESSAKKAEIAKSDYGPKPMKLYSQKDNAQRKSNRTGQVAEVAGPNKEVKQIAPGGRQSGKHQAIKEALEARRKSKFNPVKIYTPEEIAQLEVERNKKLKLHDLEKDAGQKKPETHGHHTIPVAERGVEGTDWHLRNLWETPGSPGGWRTIKDMPRKEHEKLHAERKRKKLAASELEKQDVDVLDQPQDWQSSYLQHQPDPQQPQEKENHDHFDIPAYVMSNWLASGYLVRHPKRGIIRNRKIRNRGDGAPLMRSEEGPLELIHYSPIQGLKEIDPEKMGSSGVRSGGQYKYGLPETKTSFHYIKGTEPEDIVTSGAASRYKSFVHPQHLYDLQKDPKGLVSQAIQNNGGAWNTDMIFSNIKKNGYKGIWAPNADHPVIKGTVQLFHPHPIATEENLHA